MIYFNFRLLNPFIDRFDVIFSKDKLLSKYKAITFGLSKTNEFLSVVFKLNFREDHAGFYIEFGLLYYVMTIHFYDIRHWDIDNKCWDSYEN